MGAQKSAESRFDARCDEFRMNFLLLWSSSSPSGSTMRRRWLLDGGTIFLTYEQAWTD